MIPSKLNSQTGVFGSAIGANFHTSLYGGVYGYGQCIGFDCYQSSDPLWVALDNQATLIVCFHYQNASDIGKRIVGFYDSGTAQCYVSSNATTGFVELHRGDGTLLATGKTNVCDGNWHYIETSITFHGTAGAAIVQVDLVQQFSLTSQNTHMSTNNYANTVLLNGQNTNGIIYYDNLVVMDGTGSTFNSFQGEMRIFSLLPNAVGTYSQWTPSAGTNFSCVNDNPADGDTTYVSTATVGNNDSYKFSSLPFTAGSIKSVWVNLTARNTDVGIRQVAVLARESGTNYVGSSITLGSSYYCFGQMYTTNDPAGNPWTISNFNNIEFGIQEIS